MRLALLLAWLLMGAVDSDWWSDNGGLPSDVDSNGAADVTKMDGPDEPPKKP